MGGDHLILPRGKISTVGEFKNHLSDNEESLGEDASKQGRIGYADAEVTFIDGTSNDARNKKTNMEDFQKAIRREEGGFGYILPDDQ
ncbi:hypothetical protein Tco_0759569 [Tanacetum coccineum]